MYIWEWSKRIGYVDVKSKNYGVCRLNLYQGNGYLIFINEDFPDNKYQVMTFWADEQHAKNCLGLTKGYDNIYTGIWDEMKFWLDGNYDHCFKIARLLKQAKINFILEF